MIVVHAPVAQKVNNSFPMDKSLSRGYNLSLASSRLFKAWIALFASQLSSRRVSSELIYPFQGRLCNFYPLNKTVVKWTWLFEELIFLSCGNLNKTPMKNFIDFDARELSSIGSSILL